VHNRLVGAFRERHPRKRENGGGGGDVNQQAQSREVRRKKKDKKKTLIRKGKKAEICNWIPRSRREEGKG